MCEIRNETTEQSVVTVQLLWHDVVPLPHLQTGRITYQSILLFAILLATGLVLDPYIVPYLQSKQEDIGGDLRREMEFVQQFGAITSAILIAATVWLLDPASRKKLIGAAAGCLTSAAAVFVLKSLLGRPRPKLQDAWGFVWPWKQYTWMRGETSVTRYAWEFWQRGTHDIWSMPSAHTASAFALAGVLTLLYPSLRPLMIVLGCIVALCRVVLGAHYISDVMIGGAIGWTIAPFIAVRVNNAIERGRPVRADATLT